MCGIAGVVSLRRYTNNLIDLEAMLYQMTHRGPDDEGIHIEATQDYNVSFGHRRLSIIDLSKLASQPMSFENLTLVFNGEIYNFRELKIELELSGYIFNSNSDSEVVLKAFHKWGTGCFHKFNGMWSIAILDKKSSTITLCRDRAGVKPLYWFIKDDNFYFASELTALSRCNTFRKDICQEALSLYFQFGYIREPYTIFKEVYKLESGCIIEVDLLKGLPMKISKYWSIGDLYRKDKLDIDYNHAKIILEEKMHRAFNFRMVSDVPVGIFLSGGYDSTAVAAILQKSLKSRLETFTIGFTEDRFNEAPQAKRISAHLGASHNELYFNYKELTEMIHLLPDVLDEPLSDSSLLPSLLVSKFAKSKVSVALSADGGDEMFGGYPVLSDAICLSKQLSRTPHIFKQFLLEVLKIVDIVNFKNSIKCHKLKEILHCNSSLEILQLYSKTLFNAELEPVYGLKPMALFSNYDFAKSDLDLMLINLFNTYLNNNVLRKLDMASMRFSLESREPFLDFELMDFVVQLPNHYKVDEFGARKIILKDIVHKYIPQEMFQSRKMGFSVPPNYLMNIVNKNFDFDLLQRLIDLRIIVDQNIKNQVLQNWRLKWSLFVFMSWYRKNMI